MGGYLRADMTARRGTLMQPHRVTYWTGIWEPRREAISKEVSWLRSELAPGSPVVAFTPQPSRLLVRERVLRIHYKRWLLLRGAALLMEQAGELSHVFGGVGAVAHFLHLLGRRPILLTVMIPGPPLDLALYSRVQRFVAQSRSLAATLTGAGVSPRFIEIIYPALNIGLYAPHRPPSESRFRLLFASSPAEPQEIDQRGIGLLIELARLRPDIDVIVVWRRWGRVAEARRILASRHPPPNFKVEEGDVLDMPALYRDVHATVCCFEDGYGKAAPNSVVEGLASGRPALIARTSGIADLIGEWHAGVVTERTAEGLASGVDDLRSSYGTASVQARRLAEAEFDDRRAADRYASLYRTVAAGR
jgi:glycosyltransferase involved in cell wall biosynthesis